MKKRLYLITTILLSAAALSLSSCLKDSRYVDLTKVGTIVEFPFGGQVYFATSYQGLAGGNDTLVEKFAVNVASPTVPTTATPITFDVDNPATVAAYNAANPAITFLAMPANAYVFTQNSITIPAGVRDTAMTLTIYASLLDPSKSYMLPITIKSAGGLNISGNQGTMYYHIIGNDFAGAYEHFYTRWSDGDSTTVASNPRTDEGPTTFSAISPVEFTVATTYYTAPRYDVTFTKTIVNNTAMYSNWAIQFYPPDVAAGGQWASNITVVTPPKFAPNKIAFDPNKQYTYAQSLELFRFYFQTASRALIDDYTHL